MSRDETLRIRLAADELDLFRRAASVASLSLSAYTRHVLTLDARARLSISTIQE